MRFLLFLLITFCFVQPHLQAQEYLWPTDSGQFLSSTFGETRSAHFHAGLDIKTWGREGYRVFAARDGILYRLLVTERGYGKAIYLKHSDGTYTVYAHLQRFNTELQAVADSIRLPDFSFEMDARLDTLGIEFKQGDLIGFTGSTGIGPPHLHFEIRDSEGNPVNALTTNLEVRDELPPVFSSVIIEPLDKESRIEGRAASHYIRSAKNGTTHDYNFGTVNISGKAGIAVNVFDRANNVPNAYAIYSLALIHETDTLFYQELDKFSYEKTSQMKLDRIAPFGSTRRGHQRLYPKDGNEIPFYKKISPASIIQLEDTPATYSIVASDYFGNTSTAKIVFQQASIKSPNTNESVLSIPTKKWYWKENWVSPDLTQTFDLEEADFGLKWSKNQRIILRDSLPPVIFTRIIPGETTPSTSPDQRMRILYNPGSFFDTLTTAESYQVKQDEIQISLQPQMLPVNSQIGIQFYLGEQFSEGNRYRLFRVDPADGELSYVDSRLIGKTIHGFPSKLGEFVIKADNNEPELSNFRIYKTDYGEWRATVRIEDELSGIDSHTAEFFINDVQGIAEYDYEEDLLIYYLPEFIPQKNNTAIIRVMDKAGNQIYKTFETQVSGF